jgi:hypothetical protein
MNNSLPIALAGSTGQLPGNLNWMNQLVLNHGSSFNFFSPKNDSLYEQDPAAFLKWEMDHTLNNCGSVIAFLDDLPSGSMGCNNVLVEYAAKFGSKMYFCSKTDLYQVPETKAQFKDIMRGRTYLSVVFEEYGVKVFDTFEDLIEGWLKDSQWNNTIVSLGLCGEDYLWRESIESLSQEIGWTHYNPQLPPQVEWTPERATQEVAMKEGCPFVVINLDDSLFPTLAIASMAEVSEMIQKPKFVVVVADFGKNQQLSLLADPAQRASFIASRLNLQLLLNRHCGPRLKHVKTIDEAAAAVKSLIAENIEAVQVK